MPAIAQIDAHLACIKVKVTQGKPIQFHLDGIVRAYAQILAELNK